MPAQKVQTFISPQGRIAFPNLFVPFAQPNPDGSPGKPRYSCTLVFPKLSADMSEFRAAFDSLVKTEFGGEARGVKNPIKDGDTDDATRPEFADCWFIRFSSDAQHPPQVCGPDPNQKITAEHKAIYPGCWCRLRVRPYTYRTATSKGVSFGMGNVQKCRDDQPFVTSTDPTEDFDMIDVQVLDVPSDMFS